MELNEITDYVTEPTALRDFARYAGVLLFGLLAAVVSRAVKQRWDRPRSAPSTTARRLLEAVQNADLDSAVVIGGKDESVCVRGRGAQVHVSTRNGTTFLGAANATRQEVSGLSRAERRLLRQAARDLKARLAERNRDNHDIAVAALLKLL